MARAHQQLDAESKKLLSDILARHRDEIVGRAADPETAERVIAAQSRALLTGDEAQLHALVDDLSARRAPGEAPASTLLGELLSFRRGLEGLLPRDAGAVTFSAFAVLAAVDAVVHDSLLRAADAFTKRELRMVAERRDRELDGMMQTLDRQHAMLNAATSPVIEVWEGILVVPLIGEIGPERSSTIYEKVLGAVVQKRSFAVLVDITGLTSTGEEPVSEILRLVRAVRLLGAEAMLVGVSARAALRLATLDVSLSEIRSFATLHDGLRAALRRAGMRVERV